MVNRMATKSQDDGLWLLIGLLVVVAVFVIIAVFANGIEQLLINIGVPASIAGPVRTIVFAGIIIAGILRGLRLI